MKWLDSNNIYQFVRHVNKSTTWTIRYKYDLKINDHLKEISFEIDSDGLPVVILGPNRKGRFYKLSKSACFSGRNETIQNVHSVTGSWKRIGSKIIFKIQNKHIIVIIINFLN